MIVLPKVMPESTRLTPRPRWAFALAFLCLGLAVLTSAVEADVAGDAIGHGFILEGEVAGNPVTPVNRIDMPPGGTIDELSMDESAGSVGVTSGPVTVDCSSVTDGRSG